MSQAAPGAVERGRGDEAQRRLPLAPRIAAIRWHTPAALLLGMAVAVFSFGQGGQDDTYISYWPARALAEHGEITNYNGDRLEQSSTLSLVLILALLYKLTPLSVPTLGFVTSLASAAGACLLAVRLGARMGLSSRAGLAASIMTVASFGYWATSGMETTLAALSALWFIHVLAEARSHHGARYWGKLAFASFLFAGVRPETPLLLLGLVIVFVPGIFIARALGDGSTVSVRTCLARAATALAGGAAVFAFRKLYFDAWLPNPALLKTHGFDLDEGWQYLWKVAKQAGFYPVGLYLLGAVLVGVRFLRGSAPVIAILVAALAAGQLGFVVLSGGDWMLGGRFFAPIIPALTVVGFVVIEAIARRRWQRAAFASVYVALNLVFLLSMLRKGESDGQPLWGIGEVIGRVEARIGPHSFSKVEFLNKVHRRDAVTISELLPIADAVVAHVGDRPVYVMTGQAGMIAYHLAARHFRRIILLDLWSLTDRRLFDCYPPGAVAVGRWGTWFGIRPLLEHEAVTARCGIPPPDIYYNEGLQSDVARHLRRLGYTILYHQHGHIEHPDALQMFPSSNSADGHIAVRKSIARALRLKPKPAWRWDL